MIHPSLCLESIEPPALLPSDLLTFGASIRMWWPGASRTEDWIEIITSRRSIDAVGRFIAPSTLPGNIFSDENKCVVLGSITTLPVYNKAPAELLSITKMKRATRKRRKLHRCRLLGHHQPHQRMHDVHRPFPSEKKPSKSCQAQGGNFRALESRYRSDQKASCSHVAVYTEARPQRAAPSSDVICRKTIPG